MEFNLKQQQANLTLLPLKYYIPDVFLEVEIKDFTKANTKIPVGS